jgi:hypothetical protein
MLAFGLGMLSLVLISHSHLSAVPQLRHAQRGHGRRYHLRTALEFDTVSQSHMLCNTEKCQLPTTVTIHAYVGAMPFTCVSCRSRKTCLGRMPCSQR